MKIGVCRLGRVSFKVVECVWCNEQVAVNVVMLGRKGKGLFRKQLDSKYSFELIYQN